MMSHLVSYSQDFADCIYVVQLTCSSILQVHVNHEVNPEAVSDSLMMVFYDWPLLSFILGNTQCPSMLFAHN